MKVVIKVISEYTLLLDEETGFDSFSGQTYDGTLDVLADDTADKEEKLRTIVFEFNSNKPYPSWEEYSVFAFNNDGDMQFSGQMSV